MGCGSRFGSRNTGTWDAGGRGGEGENDCAFIIYLLLNLAYLGWIIRQDKESGVEYEPR